MSDDLKERGREGLERIVLEHPFFTSLAEHHVRLAAGCAKNVRFEKGGYLLREGAPADEFYLLREGSVALEINVPGRPGIIIQTVGPGDIVGVSWLVAPYRWTYDARALEPVRAISLDAKCLRGKCEADHDLGFAMMNCFVPMLVQRLQATRLQLLDVYGRHD
jgi:CRP/FNR family cyclic AMP-dependent transcriptional regulator